MEVRVHRPARIAGGEALARVRRGIASALRAHRGAFVGTSVVVFLLNLALPLLVLSLARKPWDYFSVNPWLHNAPHWILADPAPLGQKLAFLYQAALFWFVASSPYDEPEWGFAATTADIVRWAAVSLLFGMYFALWIHHRRSCAVRGKGATPVAKSGVAGVALTTLGFSTLPCSVAGCGAPVLPVLALALTGLSSVTLSWINTVSRAAFALVVLGVAAGVVYLGWREGEV
jgi:hypothetical protein